MNEQAIKDIINRTKTKCNDMALETLVLLPGEFIYQPKWDGWWTLAVVEKGLASIYTSGGRLLDQNVFFCNQETSGVLIGEYGYGTPWGKEHFENVFVAHDALWIENEHSHYDFATTYYTTRLTFLKRLITPLNKRFVIIENIDRDKVLSFAKTSGFEGVVAKLALSKFGDDFWRYKTPFDFSLVLTAVTCGSGKYSNTMGSIVCSAYRDGVLAECCLVGGGFTDAQRDWFWASQDDLYGTVVDVTASQVFQSGSLRHPRFKRVRTDKTNCAADCPMPKPQ